MTEPRISVIIPHVPDLNGTNEALLRCINSLKGYDELIVVSNAGTGYGKNVNAGLKKATGDYFVISNNDITMLSGSLRDFSITQFSISVPKIIPAPRDHLPRSFFGVPKKIYDRMLSKYGYFFDEECILHHEGWRHIQAEQQSRNADWRSTCQ